MAYASKQDMIDSFGERTMIMLSDRDEDGEMDEAAITAALEAASSEIDGYLSVRYSTPIVVSPTPQVLQGSAIDIAAYRLASNGLALSEDLRKRYEDRRQLLRDISQEKANLGVPELDQGAGDGAGDFRAPKVSFGISVRI